MSTTPKTTDEMFAAIGAAFASRAPAVEPVSAEQAKATRAALDAKFRAGETVMNRDSRGCFTGAVKVATFGICPTVGQNHEADAHAFALAAE